MVPLLSYLREVGLAPVKLEQLTPLDELLREYGCWMVQERNLAPATVVRYDNTARRFLSERASTGGVFQPAGLTGVEVNAFLLGECGRVSAGSAKGRVAELRSILNSCLCRASQHCNWEQRCPRSAAGGSPRCLPP